MPRTQVSAGSRPLSRSLFGPPGLAVGLALAGLALAGLDGCATYQPLPLPSHDDLVTQVAPIGLPPLDMVTVATLAVLNNPDLKARRAAVGVAQAQAFAEGLLPDPQLSYSVDHPVDHVISSTDPRYPEYNAYGLGLSLDLQTLLTHSSRRAAASAAYRQARLELLWQEWQTVAEARTLYVQLSIATQQRNFLSQAEQIYARAAVRTQRAETAGNATLEQTSADLAVLLDVRTRLGTAQRSVLQTQQALRTLLGIRPEVNLPLASLPAPALPRRDAVQAAAARLAQHRPDLRALQEGYQAQEATLRAAVLSQFPNISVGVTHARDVSDVHTIGAQVSLTLPLFERGRGNIAIQRATRQQLHAEFQARLDQAQGDVWQLWREIGQLDAQLQTLNQQLPRLRSSVDAAQRAFLAGNFPAASYLTLVSSQLAALDVRSNLLQNLWSDAIALATVLGTQVQPSGAN